MKLSVLIVLLAFSTISCKSKEATQQEPAILFSNVDFRDTTQTTTTHINQFELNRDAYLNMHFTLEEPLVQSLQKLAPELSPEELLSKGNFQFVVSVDGKVIHQQNLNTGAGSPDSKTKQLEHRIPLAYPERIDYWGWYMWLRFMKISGGRDALTLGDHQISIEVRPYIDHNGLKVGDLLAKGQLAVQVHEATYDQNLTQIQAIAPNSGWEISPDTYDKSKIEALNKKIAQKRFEDINGIVVIKDSKLLLEEYFNGAGRDSLHNPRSVGKTIASTVMGVAIEEGHIKSTSQTLKDFYNLKSFDNYDPAKETTTLKSLLSMSSSFIGDDDDYDNPGNENYMYDLPDWVKFALDQPINPKKEMEKDYAYFTAGVVVLGDILHKSVPGGLVDYTGKKIFEPLGIDSYRWQYTPTNVGNTAGGLQLRAVDFAKWGQLYKNKGMWNGKRVLTEDWVNQSFTKHVTQPNTEGGTYGYLFWNNSYTVNGKEYEVWFCTGNGGNKIFVFKDIPYVIVITASAYNMPYAHSNVDMMMEEYILPAVLGE